MLQPVSNESSARGSWLWLWRKPPKLKTEPVCGKCGYVVTGLADFICPECGSDLREAGIVKRTVAVGGRAPPAKDWPAKVRRRMHVQIALLVVAALIMTPFLPLWRTDRRDMVYVPKSVAYRSVMLSSAFTRLHFLTSDYVQEPEALQVRLLFTANDGSPRELTVDLPAMRMTYPVLIRGPVTFSGSHTVALDRNELLTWLNRETGASPTDPKVQAEADALMRVFGRFNNAAPPGWDSLTSAVTTELAGPFNRGTWLMSGTAGMGQMLRTALPLLAVLLLAVTWLRARAEKKARAILIAEGKWEEPPPDPRQAEARTLTVMFTDVKDFTARAASSSRADLVRLVRANRRLVERAVTQHRGRVVKTAGDGILCSFESATDAVLAALRTQRLARLQSQTGAAAESVELRIGISTGEVAIEGDDVYGPAVNVAARVQSLAVAGEVYLTDATRQAVTAAEVRIEPVGTFELKGVSGEVAVYRALPRAEAD